MVAEGKEDVFCRASGGSLVKTLEGISTALYRKTFWRLHSVSKDLAPGSLGSISTPSIEN